MCVHSEDITIKCIFVSAILNLSHRGQQSLPIPQASKMASSAKKTMFCTEWTKCVSKCVSTNGLETPFRTYIILNPGQTLRGNIEVLQNCLSFEKSFGCIYTETAFKDIQNV